MVARRFDQSTARSLAGPRQRDPVGPHQQGMETLERHTLIARSRIHPAQHQDQDTVGRGSADEGGDGPDHGEEAEPARSSGPAPDREEPDLAFDPIAAALRQIHDHVAAEDIPEDFLRLLDQLDDSQSREPGK